MKLTKWEFNGLAVGMIEDENGELFCTTNAITKALNVPRRYIHDIYNDNRKEFDFLKNRSSLRYGISVPKSFLDEYRNELNIVRIRQDMKFWSEDEMLTFAFHIRSKKAIEFRCELRSFIKENARKSSITKEQYDALVASSEKTNAKVKALENLILTTLPAANETASMSGRLLRMQRGTKQLRQNVFTN